jgi:lipopolysaccharide assembly outer membrane protein LptD (OstA)
MRFGLEYGVTDRLMVGVGRSNVNKAYDSFLKYKILRQGSGKHNIPISLSYFGSAVCNTVKWSDPNRDNYFSSRMQYTHQLLIARKFNNDLSLQIAPTLVHKNLVPTLQDKNDILAMGFGGRYKLTQRFSVNGEYIYVLPNQITSTFYNSLSLGVDIETGGHVFQLHLTNSTSMLEPGFITESVGQWKNGGIHFGFNVSRVFTVKDKREKPED